MMKLNLDTLQKSSVTQAQWNELIYRAGALELVRKGFEAECCDCRAITGADKDLDEDDCFDCTYDWIRVILEGDK